MADNDRTVEAVARTISEVLEKKKYWIDYYQREYKWAAKQLAELVSDLTGKFLQLHDPSHSRKEVAKYPGYFLGSIIVSQKGVEPFIVDGQQRLTSITIFLTYLRRLQHGRDDAVDVDQLIFSERFGEKSFNLHVADRLTCMESLFETGAFDPPSDAVESVVTLVDRYSEIDDLFPDELRGGALPYFIDWLKDRVQLVQITAYSDDDAYAIFETMNDRGLRLAPEDMLKGYLLANIVEGAPRDEATKLWRDRIRDLNDAVENGGSDFIKAWLRSQYAMKIRQGRSETPEDWDRIGVEFHRWLRDHHQRVGLATAEDFRRFVTQDLDFFSRQWLRIAVADAKPVDVNDPLRFVAYNAHRRFTLQEQVLLAPLGREDSPRELDQKLEVVGRFVDIFIAWKVWNGRSTGYSTMKNSMFAIMRDVRGKGAVDTAAHLRDYLLTLDETFDGAEVPIVHQQNRNQIHNLLARITDYVAVGSGEASPYWELVNRGSVRYEVEHIWADHADRHVDEFSHPDDFSRQRSRIGGLLLLPKSFNASYGDDPYEEKLPHYFKQNILAASLHPTSYEKSPGFTRLVRESGLEFRPYEEFRTAEMDQRSELYREIAKRVWNPDDLLKVAE